MRQPFYVLTSKNRHLIQVQTAGSNKDYFLRLWNELRRVGVKTNPKDIRFVTEETEYQFLALTTRNNLNIVIKNLISKNPDMLKIVKSLCKHDYTKKKYGDLFQQAINDARRN